MCGDSGIDSVIIDHKLTGEPMKQKSTPKTSHNQAMRCFAWLLVVCLGVAFTVGVVYSFYVYFYRTYEVLALAQ